MKPDALQAIAPPTLASARLVGSKIRPAHVSPLLPRTSLCLMPFTRCTVVATKKDCKKLTSANLAPCRRLGEYHEVRHQGMPWRECRIRLIREGFFLASSMLIALSSRRAGSALSVLMAKAV
jgi:hypothetical protein